MRSSCSSAAASSRSAVTKSCWAARACTRRCTRCSCSSHGGNKQRQGHQPSSCGGWRDRRLHMIKSMTGFASATRESEAATITVTIRAVNHRHLDLQLACAADARRGRGAHPRDRAAADRPRAGRAGRRTVQYRQTASVEVEFNESLAVALSAALETARSRGIVQGTADARRPAAAAPGARGARAAGRARRGDGGAAGRDARVRPSRRR